jgi:hypothetical protein
LYVSTSKQTYILTYPRGTIVGSLSPKGALGVICPDETEGYVYLLDGGNLRKYARGATKPTTTTPTPAGGNYGCAVDPTTGAVAVAHYGEASIPSGIYVYPDGSGTPQIYADPSIQKYLYCGYDSQGNLFVDGISYGIGYIFAELPEGSASFTNITLDRKIGSGLVQWDGSYITIEVARDPTIYRIAVSGSSGTVVGTTTLYTHVGKLKAYAPPGFKATRSSAAIGQLTKNRTRTTRWDTGVIPKAAMRSSSLAA